LLIVARVEWRGLIEPDEPGPHLLKRRFGLPADEDGQIRFFRHGVRWRDHCGKLDFAKGLAKEALREADGNDDIAGITARPPETVLIVSADGQGETELRSKVVDGRSFSVVLGEDGRLRAIQGGQCVVDAGHRGGLFGPTVHVTEKLREVPERNVLDVDRLHVPEAAILYGRVHREPRAAQWPRR